jgi:rubrerythrin
MDEKIEKMRSMASLEEEHAIRLEGESLELGDAVVYGLVGSIAHDSKKHAGIYRTIAALLERGNLAIPESQADEFASRLKKHIEVETKMRAGVIAMLNGEGDDRVRFLLSEILSDEERHHRFLSNLLETIIERDTISDEDIWNMIWRDVESHGAPPDHYV